jgi:hypothetical protein
VHSSEPSERELLYRKILGASEQQRLALQAQDPEGFFDISTQREALFERLQGLEAPPPSLGKLEREAISRLIEQILVSDKQVEALMSHLGAHAYKELQTLQAGLQALHSYLPENSDRSAFFIDRSR